LEAIRLESQEAERLNFQDPKERKADYIETRNGGKTIVLIRPPRLRASRLPSFSLLIL
jgi:hypothetical protein